MNAAQIFSAGPSWIALAILVALLVFAPSPTPNGWRWIGLAVMAGFIALVIFGATGCASVDGIEGRETVINSQGVRVLRTYGLDLNVAPGSNASTEGLSYQIGPNDCMVLYRSRYPSESTVAHEEEGHCNGMVHTPWKRCGDDMCATVTVAGGPYQVGDLIRSRARSSCLAGSCYRDEWEEVTHGPAPAAQSATVLQGATFKPVPKEILDRIFGKGTP